MEIQYIYIYGNPSHEHPYMSTTCFSQGETHHDLSKPVTDPSRFTLVLTKFTIGLK